MGLRARWRMAAVAVFYFHHEAVGKKTHSPGTAAAHARYVMRRSALQLAVAERMPTQYHSVQRFLEQREQESRANARVIDKFILNLPRELDEAQHVRLLRRFLDAASEGRAPYLFCIHNDKPDNPHAHVIFVDADPATGRRVFKTSEAGSSFRLRKLWEEVCNDELARAGYEITISRWGKAKQVERESSVAMADPVTATPCPQMHLAPNPPVVDCPAETEQPEPGMDDQLAEIRQDGIHSSLRSVITFVLGQEDEINRIVGARETLAKYRADYARIDRDIAENHKKLASIRAHLYAHEQASRLADTNLAQHKGRFGRLKGIAIGGWKSSARVRAEAAKMQAAIALYNLKSAQGKAQLMMRDAQVLEADKVRLQAEAQGIQMSMGWYGRDDEINTAESMLKHTIAVNVADMDTQALTQAYMKGEITPDQYDRVCRIIDKQNEKQRQRDNGFSH